MASGSYRQVYCLCPYYISDDGKHTITCEGIIGGTTNRTSFKFKSEYELQMEVFCCNKYRNCEIYSAINKKYEGGDSG